MCVCGEGGRRGVFEKTKKEKQRYFLPKSYRLFPAVKTEYKIKRRNLKPTALKKKKERKLCMYVSHTTSFKLSNISNVFICNKRYKFCKIFSFIRREVKFVQ